MRATVTSDRALPRLAVFAAAAVAGALVGAAILLWASYGAAVFQELISAGLALCF